MKARSAGGGAVGVAFYLFLTSALDWGGRRVHNIANSIERSRFSDTVLEAILEKFTSTETLMMFLLWEYYKIKILSPAGEMTAPCEEEVLMSSLQTICFGNIC